MQRHIINVQARFSHIEAFLLVFSGGKKPSVAAIQGLALGGGLELTMVCRDRIKECCQILA